MASATWSSRPGAVPGYNRQKKGLNAAGFFSAMRNDYDEATGTHLQRVYAAVGMALVSFALGAYLAMAGFFMSISFLLGLGSIGGMLYVFFSGPENQPQKLSVLLGSAFAMGHGSWPLIAYSMLVDPGLVMTAALATSVVFVAFSASALMAKRGTYLFLGWTLIQVSLLSAMLIMTQMFFGFPGRWALSVYPYISLAVACGFVLYDTQVIVERFQLGVVPDPAKDACFLFIDAIDMFRHLLIVLTENKRQEQRRRND